MSNVLIPSICPCSKIRIPENGSGPAELFPDRLSQLQFSGLLRIHACEQPLCFAYKGNPRRQQIVIICSVESDFIRRLLHGANKNDVQTAVGKARIWLKQTGSQTAIKLVKKHVAE